MTLVRGSAVYRGGCCRRRPRARRVDCRGREALDRPSPPPPFGRRSVVRPRRRTRLPDRRGRGDRGRRRRRASSSRHTPHLLERGRYRGPLPPRHDPEHREPDRGHPRSPPPMSLRSSPPTTPRSSPWTEPAPCTGIPGLSPDRRIPCSAEPGQSDTRRPGPLVKVGTGGEGLGERMLAQATRPISRRRAPAVDS